MSSRFKAEIVVRPIASLRAYAGNARTHSRRQIGQIARSIERFGFTNPVLIADDGEIVAGHGRVAAARQLGLTDVPTLALSHLTAEERRAYVLADNKIALNAGWDMDTLSIELQGLIDIGFEIEETGFSLAEIDMVLDGSRDRRTEQPGMVPEDQAPEPGTAAVTRHGDIWRLGRHRLICGDARVAGDHAALLGDERVDLVFTDPPYNVRIDGHVSGQGAVRHREFAFASGEMTVDAFTRFLTESLGAMGACCKDGSIAFVCMDWRHMREVLDAGNAVFTELKNLCVWNKTNGGMGRSTAPSMNWCSSSRSATRRTSTASGWATRAATGPTSGIIPGSPASVLCAMTNWPCIRRSSPWRWWPMPSAIAPDAARLCSTASAGRERP